MGTSEGTSISWDSLRSRRAFTGALMGVAIQLMGLYSHFDYLGVALAVILIVGGLLKARTKPEQIQVVGIGIGMLSTEAVAVVLVFLKLL